MLSQLRDCQKIKSLSLRSCHPVPQHDARPGEVGVQVCSGKHGVDRRTRGQLECRTMEREITRPTLDLRRGEHELQIRFVRQIL